MKTVKIKKWGNEYEIGFSREKYQDNGNLAIQAWVVENGVFTEPFCMLTVNLSVKEKENRAFIDSNNCPRELIDVLEENEWINCTYLMVRSGWCDYFEYEFTDEFLKEIVS